MIKLENKEKIVCQWDHIRRYDREFNANKMYWFGTIHKKTEKVWKRVLYRQNTCCTINM